jgi:hypothetical protein
MGWIVQVECRVAGEVLHRRERVTVSRALTPLRPAQAGLTRRDGATVLRAIQPAVVADQVEVTAGRTREHCQWGARRTFRQAATLMRALLC